jgi:FAD/FMN-containing dehydrogenase
MAAERDLRRWRNRVDEERLSELSTTPVNQFPGGKEKETTMAGKLTRRELLKRAALAGAGLSAPFIFRRYAHAAGEIDPATVKKFATSLKGRLTVPGDKDYDSARKLWNARYDKHPAMIARCAVTDDVVRSIEFARKNNLVISVRSGGHDPAGFSSNDGGLLVDLGSMNAIKLNPDRMTASVEPGAHVGELYGSLSGQGLVAVSGGCQSVGVGGITTGGGESWLSSKYGTASDNVTSAEVVTADGRVVRASSDESSDLFWAVCGGSGNFGVVTSFELRTIPMTHLIKGSLSFPASQCREVLRFYREFIAGAPEELTSGVSYGVPGPADQIFVTVCYCGDPAKGEAVIRPLRSFSKPGADDIRTVPAHAGLLDEEPPKIGYFESAAAIPHLSDANIDVLSEAIKGAPVLYTAEVFAIGSGVVRGNSAYPFRFPFFEVDCTAFWRDENGSESATKWAEQTQKALAPSSRGTYVNYLGVPDQARAAFGKNYERLAAIKNKYDPTNFFRMNQNIKPTG